MPAKKHDEPDEPEPPQPADEAPESDSPTRTAPTLVRRTAQAGLPQTASPLQTPPAAVAQQAEGKQKAPVAPAWNPNLRLTSENVNDAAHTEPFGGSQFRGVCLKCGWQSTQPTAEGAAQAVQMHAGKHFRE